MSKRIVIIGGGNVGTQLAKSLDDKADITLIEAQSHFVHAPAMIRALVDPTLLDSALYSYSNVLKRGKVIQARASQVDGSGVTLEDGTHIGADYIVVATGSSHATPFKANGGTIEEFRANNAKVHAKLKEAQTIAIVGAGAVGTELAGEIAHFMPEKKVSLISSDDSLFPTMPPRLGQGLESKLKAMGVTLVKGALVENLESMTEPYTGTLSLNNGKEITADLIFPAIGSRATSDLLTDLPGARKSSASRIKTDAWMRPSELPNVFAAGDVADAGDAMTVVAVGRQEPWLAKLLVSLINGGKVEDAKPYKPWDKAPILVPLGPKKGNSFLVKFTAGNFLTSAMKGKDLFRSKYNKLFARS